MKKTILVTVVALLLMGVFSGCGSNEGEAVPASDPAPATPALEVTWEGYQQWLIDTFAATSPDPEGVATLIRDAKSWEDIDMANGPWGKIFGEENYNASTWDEYVATGGIGTYNTNYVDLPDENAPASDEASGEASGEPPAGDPPAI